MRIHKMEKGLIVVLGMHRSGTSAITRGLTTLGIQLGENLIQPEPDNPKGFWEDRDIAELNMELLKYLGHDLYHSSLLSIDKSLFGIGAIPGFKLRAIDLLREKTTFYSNFGIKDPRIARLLDFWQEVFEHLSLKTAYVIAVRNPLSVARSMQTRNKFSLEKTHYLWLEHMVPAVLKTASARRVFVNYDYLMDAPARELHRIASALSLPESELRDKQFQEYHESFLTKDLCHSRYTQSDLHLDPSVPRAVIDAYEVLTRLCSDELSADCAEVSETFLRLQRDLIDLRPALRYATHLEEKVEVLDDTLRNCKEECKSFNDKVVEQNDRVDQLNRIAAQRDQEAANLNRSLAEKSEKVEVLSRLLDEKASHIAQLDQLSAQGHALIDNLNKTLAEQNAQIDQLNQTSAQRDQLVMSLNQVLSEKNNRIDHISQLSIERKRQINKLNRTLIQRKNEIDNLNQHVSARDQMIDSLRQQATQQSAEIVSLQSRINELQMQSGLLQTSWSWRLTQPFRKTAQLLSRRSPSRSTGNASMSVSQSCAEQDEISDFDRDFYMASYPDVVAGGLDPLQHYLEHGRKEGRLPRAPEPIQCPVRRPFISNRPTVLVVSHDASRTGAPILAWNICRELSRMRCNVIALLLGNGDIAEYFDETCNVVAGPIAPSARNNVGLGIIINDLCKRHSIDFALVNSIESELVLAPLAEQYVPTVLLIHEFFAYTRPRERLIAALRKANSVVFPARIVQQNALIARTRQAIHSSHVLAQGKCEIPSPPLTDEKSMAKMEQIKALLYPEGPRSFFVLGAGTVQYRKGIDLFVATAAEIGRLSPASDIVMLWIGQGYDPESDLAYSVYLEEQIAAAGIYNVAIMGPVENLELFYTRADALFISSRLDPMPNVAIDMMSLGKPVVCFDNTTGIAEILAENPNTAECILPAAHIEDVARLILRLHSSEAFAKSISDAVRDLAAKHFDIHDYTARLFDIGWDAHTRGIKERTDAETLRNASEFKDDFAFPPFQYPHTREKAIVDFLRSYASGVDKRRPAPGFEPAIYEQLHANLLNGVNPFAHWLRAGQPEGPWCVEVINPTKQQRLAKSKNLMAALHIHAYYMYLFVEILNHLDFKGSPLDLFVSVSSESDLAQALQLLASYRRGACTVRMVPNRGRDIGPMLTAFGTELRDYEVIGHIHTKESASDFDRAFVQRWREYLLLNLIGRKCESSDAILARFAADPQLGIVYPDDPNILDWGDNRDIANLLANRLAIPSVPDLPPSFPVGTMFWARSVALAPLFDLNLEWDDYPNEPLPYDGSMLHAIERLLPIIVAHTGYRRAAVHVPGSTR